MRKSCSSVSRRRRASGVRLSSWGITHIGRREENQDAIALPNGVVDSEGRLLADERELCAGLLVAVADGVGGRPSGRWASRTALLELTANELAESSPAVLVEAILRANTKVASASTDSLGPASTLAGIAFGLEQAIIFHVGDSRVHRLTSSGVDRLTVDHRSTRDTRSITRFLGGSTAHATPTVTSVHMERSASFLVTTDGFHDYLRPADLMLLLEVQPAAALPALIEMALDNGSTDNLSVVFCRIDAEDA
jgi:serine/threonine protein phosphatase PrpC